MKKILPISLLVFCILVCAAQVRKPTPVVNGSVEHIVKYNDNLFISGKFNQIDTATIYYLAMLDANSGALESWRPTPNGNVNCILVQNGKLIVGGSFSNIGGQSRNKVAVFDASSGTLLATAPTTTYDADALYADGNTIYFFEDYLGSGLPVVKRFDLSTGVVDSWQSDYIRNPMELNAIAVMGNYVYVGGVFLGVSSHVPLMNLVRFDKTTGAVDTVFMQGVFNWNNDWISRIVPYNNKLYVCGTFTALGGDGFFALDQNGVQTAFSISASNHQNYALFCLGNRIWVGGNSSSYGGGSSYYLSELYLPTGQITCWHHPLADNWAITRSVYVQGDTVYAGAIASNNYFHMYVGNPTPYSNFSIYPDSLNQGVYWGYNQSTGSNLTYLWEFGDGATSTLQYPSHTYASPGQYFVCLTVNNGAGCIDTYCDSSFYVFKTEGGLMTQLNILNPAVGIKETKDNFSINIYPNPLSTLAHVNLNNTTQTSTQLIAYDLTGRQIWEKSFPNANDLTVERSTLLSGMYLLEIKQHGNRIGFCKFVID